MEGTHFRVRLAVCEGKVIIERQTPSVERNSLYRETVSVCWNSYYGGRNCLGKEHTLQRELVCEEGTHFTEEVTVCGKEHTLQRDRL